MEKKGAEASANFKNKQTHTMKSMNDLSVSGINAA